MEVEVEQMEITIGGPIACKVVDSCVGTDNRRYYKLHWEPSWETEEDVLMKYQNLVEDYWREEEKKSQMQANAMVDVVLNKAVNDRDLEASVENIIAIASPEHRLDEEAPTKECPPPLLPQDREGVVHEFKCDDCPRSYTTERKLKDHRRKLHVNRGSFKCSYCPKVFSSKRGAQEHINRHTGLGPNSCPGCNKRYITLNDLEHHKKSCNGLVPKEHQCDMCQKCFATKAHLSFHMKIHVPTEQKPFGCKYCPRRFAYNHDCVHHVRLHLGEKPFKCSECDAAFHRKSYLTEHMFVHTGVSRYRCTDCGVYVKTQQMLKTHVKNAHILKKPPKLVNDENDAEDGGKDNEKKTKRDRKNDKRKNKRYKCDECKKDFRFMKELHFHQALNHKEKLKDNSLKVQFEDFEPTMVYKCKKCDKTFPHPHSLRKHSETHKLLEIPSFQQEKQSSEQNNKLNITEEQPMQIDESLNASAQNPNTETQIVLKEGALSERKQNIEDHIKIILEQANAFASTTSLNPSGNTTEQKADHLADNLIQVEVSGDQAHILIPSSTYTCGYCHVMFSTELDLTHHIFNDHEHSSHVTQNEQVIDNDVKQNEIEKDIVEEALDFAESIPTPKEDTGGERNS